MQSLHGVILAGGTGSRLRPLTNELNKHLLLVHDRPMIYCPLRTLANAGVRDVTVVTNEQDIDMVRDVVGMPGDHALDRISYVAQGEAKGVAAALASAERVVCNSPVMVVLGDNVFTDSFRDRAVAFARKPSGAHVFLVHAEDATELAVAEIEGDRVRNITEKPDPPRGGLAVAGAYLYDHTLFDRIRALKPSARGELEITALNQAYLCDGQLAHSVLTGEWADAGTFEGMNAATKIIAGAPPLTDQV